MSTMSKIGSAFGAAGGGLSATGPVGSGIGAGLGILGQILGFAGGIKDKKEEERKRKQEESAEQSKSVSSSADEDNERTVGAGEAPAAPVQPEQNNGMQGAAQPNQFGATQPIQQKGMGVELTKMFASSGSGKSWWQDG